MGKRSNEYGHLRKEEYEETMDAPGSTQGSIERANEQTLQGRRIVRARRPIAAVPTFEESGGGGGINPFNSVNLTSAAPKASFQFGTSPFTSEEAAKPAAPSAAAPLSSNEKIENLKKLNQALRAAVTMAPLTATSYTPMLEDYLGYYNAICPPKPPLILPSVPSGQETTSNATETPLAAAPAPTSSFFGNFASASPVPSSSKPTFSFAVAPSAAAPTKQPDAANEASQGANNEQFKAQAAVDPDWDDVVAFDDIKFYRYEQDSSSDKKSWVFLVKGKLRLQTNKTNASTRRMVMRDATGLKVHINMLLTDDMEFDLKSLETKKSGTLGDIHFTGMNDAERGFELFRMVTAPETAKQLHAELVEMTK